MLVNELSHYLPTYCWGATANRVLQLTQRGFGLAATMHAADAASVATDLQAGSLFSEGEHLPAITVVILGRRRATDEVNSVIEISLSPPDRSAGGRRRFQPAFCSQQRQTLDVPPRRR